MLVNTILKKTDIITYFKSIRLNQSERARMHGRLSYPSPTLKAQSRAARLECHRLGNMKREPTYMKTHLVFANLHSPNKIPRELTFSFENNNKKDSFFDTLYIPLLII